MRKQSLFASMSLTFLALAIFLIGSHPASYAADEQKKPNEAQQFIKTGSEASKKGNLDEAVKSFEQAVAADPKSAMGYVSLGNVYAKKNDTGKAIEAYNKAVSLDSKNAFAHAGLGNAYMQKGDKDAAAKEQKILSGLDKKLAESLEKRIQQQSAAPAPKK